jgi:hypothetical protein
MDRRPTAARRTGRQPTGRLAALTERRRTTGADPVRPAVVALGLLAQPLLVLLEQIVQIRQFVGHRVLLGGNRVEPLRHLLRQAQHPSVLRGEGPVEGIEMAFVMDQQCPGDVVIAGHRVLVQARRQRSAQRQGLGGADGHPEGAEAEQQREEHQYRRRFRPVI